MRKFLDKLALRWLRKRAPYAGLFTLRDRAEAALRLNHALILADDKRAAELCAKKVHPFSEEAQEASDVLLLHRQVSWRIKSAGICLNDSE